jgi:hypothetical protein
MLPVLLQNGSRYQLGLTPRSRTSKADIFNNLNTTRAHVAELL